MENKAHTSNKPKLFHFVIKDNVDRLIDVSFMFLDIFWTMECCILQRSTIPCAQSLLSPHFTFIKLLKVCSTNLYKLHLHVFS